MLSVRCFWFVCAEMKQNVSKVTQSRLNSFMTEVIDRTTRPLKQSADYIPFTQT